MVTTKKRSLLKFALILWRWFVPVTAVLLLAVGAITFAVPAEAASTPTVTSVSPGYGPQSGGTFSDVSKSIINPKGTVNISGSGFTGATVVSFGPFKAAPGTWSVQSDSLIVAVPPPAKWNEGVSVTVTTAGGTSPANCPIIQAGCKDAFFYFSITSYKSQNFSLDPLNNQQYSVTPPSGPDGAPGGIVHECGYQKPPQPGHSYTASVAFSVPTGTTLSGNVTLDQAQNYSIPSAFLGNLTVTLNNPVQITVGLTGAYGDCIDIQTPLTFLNLVGVEVVFEPNLSVSVNYTLTLEPGSYTLGEGGWVNGGIQTPSMTLTCPSAKDCVTGSAPGWTAQASLIAGLMIRLGPAVGTTGAFIEAGAAVGLAAGTGNNGPFAEACAGGIWDGHINLPGVNFGANGPLLGPYQIAGNGGGPTQQCPLGSMNPPSIRLASPQVNGLSVSINGAAQPNTPGATIDHINWNWGDGSSGNQWFPASHIYAAAGTYTITAVAVDSDGVQSSPATVTVHPGAQQIPPTISLDTPQINGLNVSINGIAQAHTPGATIAFISWTWGDGSNGNQWFPATHTYATPGTYTVTTIAVDSNGLQSSPAQVTVTVQ